ncbi:MAG TPA: hypothetical protein VIM73_13750 [Polyangiaceae bacterium]
MATSKDKQDKSKPRSTEPEKKALAAEAAELHGDKIRVDEAANSLFTKAALVGAAGLGVALVLGQMEGDSFRRFSYAYLVAYVWALAIALGALYWVTMQNLVNAKWSIVLRRLGELLASRIPILGVLSLPIVLPVLMGNDVLYEWANHERVHSDHLLHHKAGYLNATFFLIRFVVYFGFWTFLARFFLNQSLAQDKTGADTAAATIRSKMQRAAGPAMIGFGLTLTFCAIDLVMTLEPQWFSTIFGVYYFASCVLGIHSTLVLIVLWLQGQGRLTKSVTAEHFHDIGKMMFAFTVFWAYIGFSQFMLIWYANIPEETFWYKKRFAGEWGTVAWALLFLHFVVPFFGLMSRHVKRHRKALAFWACWILVVIYVDMYWLIIPKLSPEIVPFGLIDLAAWVGFAGVLVAAMAYRAKSAVLVPIKDPRLPKSLAFENI